MFTNIYLVCHHSFDQCTYVEMFDRHGQKKRLETSHKKNKMNVSYTIFESLYSYTVHTSAHWWHYSFIKLTNNWIYDIFFKIYSNLGINSAYTGMRINQAHAGSRTNLISGGPLILITGFSKF